jgi:hypothetical protein
MKRLFLIASAFILMVFIVWQLAPKSQQSEPAPPVSEEISAAEAGNHMVVSIDPKTKEIKPDVPIPQELRQQIQEMGRFTTKGLRVETLPDGSKRLDLEGRFQNYAVAVIDSNRTHVTCVTAEELEQADEREAQDE